MERYHNAMYFYILGSSFGPQRVDISISTGGSQHTGGQIKPRERKSTANGLSKAEIFMLHPFILFLVVGLTRSVFVSCKIVCSGEKDPGKSPEFGLSAEGFLWIV